MQRDKAILFMAVCFLAGFIIGAIAAIRFVSKEAPGPAPAVESSAPGGQVSTPTPKPPSKEEIASLENVLKTDPNNLNALVSLGNLYFDGNLYQKAIDVYSRALKINPRDADVRTDMAIMYRGVKDYDRAVKELQEAAAADPKHANSRFNLGIILLHDKKDFKGAVVAWEDYLKVDPTGERAEMVRKQIQELKALAK
jgi:cytochrome c-type biogenesis protein CcmH/NrfG